MAVIKSGASTDTLTVGVTSKAARISLYDDAGVSLARRATYAAATTAPFAAASGTAPFFLIEGSATKTIRVQRIYVSGINIATTAVATSISLQKFSTAASGGTATALTLTPLDSASAASTVNTAKVFTAAPTAGTLVGTVAQARFMNIVNTTLTTLLADCDFDLRDPNVGQHSEVVLRGTSQGLGLAFGAAPGAATTMSIYVIWTEE